MTRKDFRRIASVLAYAEAHCDGEKETEVVAWVAGLFADELGRGRPVSAFRRDLFEAAALPIKHGKA